MDPRILGTLYARVEAHEECITATITVRTVSYSINAITHRPVDCFQYELKNPNSVCQKKKKEKRKDQFRPTTELN